MVGERREEANLLGSVKLIPSFFDIEPPRKHDGYELRFNLCQFLAYTDAVADREGAPSVFMRMKRVTSRDHPPLRNELIRPGPDRWVSVHPTQGIPYGTPISGVSDGVTRNREEVVCGRWTMLLVADHKCKDKVTKTSFHKDDLPGTPWRIAKAMG